MLPVQTPGQSTQAGTDEISTPLLPLPAKVLCNSSQGNCLWSAAGNARDLEEQQALFGYSTRIWSITLSQMRNFSSVSYFEGHILSSKACSLSSEDGLLVVACPCRNAAYAYHQVEQHKPCI